MPRLAIQADRDRVRLRQVPATERMKIEWKVSWLDTFAKLQAVDRAAPPSAPYLTPREHQVLQLVAQGHSNNDIRKKLGISIHTARFHVDNLMLKLDADNRAQVAATAVRMGLA